MSPRDRLCIFTVSTSAKPACALDDGREAAHDCSLPSFSRILVFFDHKSVIIQASTSVDLKQLCSCSSVPISPREPPPFHGSEALIQAPILVASCARRKKAPGVTRPGPRYLRGLSSARRRRSSRPSSPASPGSGTRPTCPKSCRRSSSGSPRPTRRPSGTPWS